ncbi:hypothetical protein DVR12_04785 [Chitinophaga silvatica]|uniref:YD repeat-containing protein n=1 Tax=Chitinophaga silvatica TaxID=2282649 RepID=A0A3E1YDE3_9BACT|nr:hypothetical protein [Chitinophaga silvatica]RFS24528.1 hypothetical protein DVR12_04785 [Chitinophaga silvatica]
MRNVLFCLLATILVSACNTRKTPRITTIGIQGEVTPQYSFQYNEKGNLVELIQHCNGDSNQTTFQYDDTNRITNIVFVEQSSTSPKVKAKATVTEWDNNGNVAAITYYDALDKPLRKAKIRWKNGLPVAMKFSDSTLACAWNNDQKNPQRKDIYIDSSNGTAVSPFVTLKTTQYEMEDSLNPLKPLANQIIICQTAAPASITPVGDLSNVFLNVSNKSPYLVKIAEREKKVNQEFESHSTYQYFYSHKNASSYPDKAWVHLSCQGSTNLDTDANFIMFYKYE